MNKIVIPKIMMIQTNTLFGLESDTQRDEGVIEPVKGEKNK